MLLVPLVGFVVVPLGLIAVTLYPLSPAAAGGIVAAATQVLTPGLGLAHLVAAWPYAAVKTFTPSVLEVACFYLLAVGSLMWIRDRNARGHSGEKRLPPRLLAAAGAALLIVMALDALYWGYQRFWHPDLRVTVIDVGHGSATLLELPGGHCLLVDAGGSYDNSVFDVGARVIAPVLWRKKIRTLDTLVLSHPNSDHLNGMFFIAQNFTVKNIWTNHDTADTLGYRRWEETLARRGIPAPVFAGLRRQETVNGVTLKILYPPVDYKTRRRSEKWRDHNNSSLVLKATFGTRAFLLPGDITAAAEAELVRTAGKELNCTVLLAPHHGSPSSSTASFLAMTDPEIVIISGARRSLGQAGHRAVVRRYRERGLQVLHTATHGAIRMRTDGRVLTVNPSVNSFR
jgi:competence protein ComEC